MQKLGQHFLKNKSALHNIVDALELKMGERVIEIGPGHGELTTPLAAACAEKQCHLISIEKDEKLAAAQKARFEIKTGDILKILPALVAEIPPGNSSVNKTTPYKIAGNIPYYITGHLLRVISELEQKPERCVLTIQKEVAERMVATPPRMNRLAASVQFWAIPKILKILPASDFSPPPKVDSAIITLVARDTTLAPNEIYYATVRAIFAQPRKTLLNNLATNTPKEKILEILKKIGIEPSTRPQNLSIEDIQGIANLL